MSEEKVDIVKEELLDPPVPMQVVIVPWVSNILAQYMGNYMKAVHPKCRIYFRRPRGAYKTGGVEFTVELPLTDIEAICCGYVEWLRDNVKKMAEENNSKHATP